MSDLMTERYGVAGPGRRRWIVAASVVVALAGLVWLAWAVWFQSTPQVQSALSTYDVVDTHRVTASVEVRPRNASVDANCLIRAYGSDHSVVGELNFRVTGVHGTVHRDVDLRTEREATSVEMVGCTAPGQSRPR